MALRSWFWYVVIAVVLALIALFLAPLAPAPFGHLLVIILWIAFVIAVLMALYSAFRGPRAPTGL